MLSLNNLHFSTPLTCYRNKKVNRCSNMINLHKSSGNAIRLSKKSKIVLVEGNYLLLNDADWCQLPENVFNETWFLSVPIPECNSRVLNRHMANGLSEQQAQQRVDQNDRLNAQLITEQSSRYADRLIHIDTF